MDFSEDDVIGIVSAAIGSPVTADASSSNNDDWDSLAHLAVLDGLDQKWPGVTSRVPDLSRAESVREIVDILDRS